MKINSCSLRWSKKYRSFSRSKIQFELEFILNCNIHVLNRYRKRLFVKLESEMTSTCFKNIEAISELFIIKCQQYACMFVYHDRLSSKEAASIWTEQKRSPSIESQTRIEMNLTMTWRTVSYNNICEISQVHTSISFVYVICQWHNEQCIHVLLFIQRNMTTFFVLHFSKVILRMNSPCRWHEYG